MDPQSVIDQLLSVVGSPESALGEQVTAHLPMALVAFNDSLQVVKATGHARALIDRCRSGQSIDQWLEAMEWGRDQRAEHGPQDGEQVDTSNGGGVKWRTRLSTVLTSGRVGVYDGIVIESDGGGVICRLVCVPLRTSNAPDRGSDVDMDMGSDADRDTNPVSGMVDDSGVCCQTAAGVLLLEDVTDDVLMRRNDAEAERLAAVGAITAKVAHELNNPLDGALRYIRLSRQQVRQAGLEDVAGYLDRSCMALERMGTIISGLLGQSRGQGGDVARESVGVLLHRAIDEMTPLAQRMGIELISPEAPTNEPVLSVQCSGSMVQVFINLIKNAIEAMSAERHDGPVPVGTLRIQLEHCEQGVRIHFADTGPGLDESVKQRLFEPFVTTRRDQGGSGLGLAISREIVMLNGGELRAENRDPQGSVFTVVLPMAHACESAVPPHQ